jgi:hypothetical protein
MIPSCPGTVPEGAVKGVIRDKPDVSFKDDLVKDGH